MMLGHLSSGQSRRKVIRITKSDASSVHKVSFLSRFCLNLLLPTPLRICALLIVDQGTVTVVITIMSRAEAAPTRVSVDTEEAWLRIRGNLDQNMLGILEARLATLPGGKDGVAAQALRQEVEARLLKVSHVRCSGPQLFNPSFYWY